ncbi:MAG: hypothetical protein ACOYL6_02790 [Bacteriovoracaceae bacterium]
MFTSENAMKLIQDSFESLSRSGTISEDVKVSPETVILGHGSSLDSIGFVTFVTEFEDRLQEATKKDCFLVLSDINEFNINNPSLTAEVLSRYAAKLVGA